MTAREYRIKHGLNVKSKLCSPAVQIHRKRCANGKNFTSETGKAASVSAVEVKARTRTDRLEVSGRTYAENDNMRLRCEAQRISDIQALAKHLGKTPTCRDMNAFVNPKNGLHTLKVNDIKSFFGVPLPMIMLRAGLIPRIRRTT
jgi:hypothetical protein